MLAWPVMAIVFVPSEKINLGSEKLTAGDVLKGNSWTSLQKCQSDDAQGNLRVERDKPHKRETQIMVGELQIAKRSDFGGRDADK